MTDSELNRDYIEATIQTAGDLRQIATNLQLSDLTELSLPEIEEIAEQIARVVPAGNVPGIILSGLARMDGRNIERDESRKHINLLFKGVRLSLDKAIYGAFFAGPAAVLYGYQQLLRISGKDIDSAFPDGTWQFYLEFALREDSAHHTNETTGFQAHAPDGISEADQLAAWLLATANFVRQIPAVLENEWRERVILKTLADIAESQSAKKGAEYRRLYRHWEIRRPYHTVAGESYPAHRRHMFDDFWRPNYESLRRNLRKVFDEKMQEQEAVSLPAYIRQMSWLAHLEPDTHSETRVPYSLDEAQIGIIYENRYYLVKLTAVTELQSARRLAASILRSNSEQPPATLDLALVQMKRSEQAALRSQLDQATQQELRFLQNTPVFINWDLSSSAQPLSRIRQGRRGVGDQALTLFRTDSSMVFDQSHIFFDGTWGAAVAQILTGEALAWARSIDKQRRVKASGQLPYSPTLQISQKLAKQARRATISPEVSAETDAIDMQSIYELRKLLKQRSDLAQLTVNDLFILYRGVHAYNYRPSVELLQALEVFKKRRSAAAQRCYMAVSDALEKVQATNPSILIPIDASRNDPRERVFPTTFRNPLTDFVALHQEVMQALESVKQADGQSIRAVQQNFDEAQRKYLRMLGGFGELLTRYKEIALSGESTNTAIIKFLGHLPGPLQKLLNQLPGRFDVLNEIIKGEEVFSNTGRVAIGSSLRRFLTAKDDNHQKTFGWGLQTDDEDVAHISLRDFRPHVKILVEAGFEDLAYHVTQDYLDAYARGMNQYIAELRAITVGSSTANKGFWGRFR